MESRPAAASRTHSTRGRFDHFVERTQALVSRSAAFAIAAGVVALWAASFPLFNHVTVWLAIIQTIAAVTSLLLLVLLENAGRRSDQASQEKLNVISDALAVLLEEHAARAPQTSVDLTQHAEELRTAVGLEDRH